MTDNNSSIHPPRPTVDPSEPEREQRLIESVADNTRKNERVVIGLPASPAYLSEHNLQLDDSGFIVGETSTEYIEPAVYSSEVFFNAPQPNDYSISDYFVAASQAEATGKEKTHLTDLHAIVFADGRFRPVTDDSLSLSKLHREVGAMLTTVTAWSNARDLTEPKRDIPDVTVNTVFSTSPTLTCLKCNYTNQHSHWDGEINNPECPQCETKWQAKSINKCTECSHEYTFDELKDTDPGSLDSPKCPHCLKENPDEKILTPSFDTKTWYYGYKE